jgi:hypothetical protein
MIFENEINGTPCRVNVLHYSPYEPMCVTGMGFGDAIPPVPEEFDYELLDDDGNIIEMEVSDSDMERLISTYKEKVDIC